MSDAMSQTYHDVMEVYKQPMSVKVIPNVLRFAAWGSTFLFAVGLSQVAYA
ncbi:hypothetical protein PTIM40_217 [Cyanophage P-TIM40]|uniref:Uncharacterized protein n=1 Tax=Cyanophage P-TIM40 TaxID=1589733 RepID=A0A0C5ABA0_9CAUD|nr:hypothetical protein AU107_gp224 [Cyanophage P-TIM40]AJK27656.1 hypothetical protein PTIM40_217 [Cyanophage P-TIM40]